MKVACTILYTFHNLKEEKNISEKNVLSFSQQGELCEKEARQEGGVLKEKSIYCSIFYINKKRKLQFVKKYTHILNTL